MPFVYGGAEVVADTLVDELRARGHEAELLALPFAWERGQVLSSALLWRLADLYSKDKPVELVALFRGFVERAGVAVLNLAWQHRAQLLQPP